jgi:glycine betaine/proline transport system ATP-binding protein
MLQKTIVFITHDFDEAIRLADRIAIMKDGEIIQIGTPEELVTRPAGDYVAEFTRDIPRAKVLSARSVMSPQDGQAASSGGDVTVAADEKIDHVAALVLDRERPVAVVDRDGKIIGSLSQQAILDVLLNRAQNA